MIKNIITSLSISVAVTIFIVSLATGTGETPAETFSSQIETVRVTLGGGADVVAVPLSGGLIFKGANQKTTTAAATALTANEIVGFNTLIVNAGIPASTLQLPASTTFPQSFLPRAGDRTSITFLAATTTTGVANSLIGFTGGTGTIVLVASSTPAGTASTTGTLGMRIDIVRKVNTDLLFLVEPFK